MKRIEICALMAVLTLLTGCSSWFGGKNLRLQSPDKESKKARLVGDLAVPFGQYPVKIEAISLVTSLHGTGSDPNPSTLRTELIDEMRTRGVANPSAVLATNNTSLVLVKGVLRPGIQKGERFDVEFTVPPMSDTTSLRGGFLLETRLREIATLGGRQHDGNVLAIAQGPCLVDPSADPKKDRIAATHGRILGGGYCLKSRPMGMVLKTDHRSIMNSSRIQNAINKRFSTFEGGAKVGVAKALTEQYVKLQVHPRYKDNINRYMQVIRAIALSETDTERLDRIARLEKEARNRDTAAEAALQLEALNKDGISPLLKALESKDREVQFYAAEALAYLDRHEAIDVLADAARNEPAFRVFAMTALSAMQDPSAFDALKEMLSLASAETRYGAFRSLWTMNPTDAFVQGELFGDNFHYHVLDVGGPEMIHVTHSRLPELVLFGKDQQFQLPITVNAGNQIIVKSDDNGEITISRFAVKEADQKRTVSPKIDEVVRAIVELGGTYPDVVQALQEAKATGALVTRFEVDALPQGGRVYERPDVPGSDGKSSLAKKLSSPLPWLFETKVEGLAYKSGKTAKDDSSSEGKESAKKETKPGFLAKMKWWEKKKDEPPPPAELREEAELPPVEAKTVSAEL